MLDAWVEPGLFQFLILGIGCPLLGLVHLLMGLSFRRFGTVLDLGLALVLAGGAAAAAGLGQPRGIWLPLAILGGVCALLGVVRLPGFGQVCKAVLALVRKPCWQGTALLLASPLAALALVHWPEEPDPALAARDPEPRSLSPEGPPLKAVAAVEVRTDKGRPVPLFRWTQSDLPPSQTQKNEGSFLAARDLAQRLIEIAPATSTYNCHGWSFAAGQFWIKGEAVELILQDNGYQRVTRPRPRDLVVYRDEEGKILHSGVVHSVGTDGLVLIESKWGEMGRFIHMPLRREVYDGTPRYYRSPRSGHMLRGLEDSLPPSSIGAPDVRGGQPSAISLQ
jgi:hypothetical protein